MTIIAKASTKSKWLSKAVCDRNYKQEAADRGILYPSAYSIYKCYYKQWKLVQILSIYQPCIRCMPLRDPKQPIKKDGKCWWSNHRLCSPGRDHHHAACLCHVGSTTNTMESANLHTPTRMWNVTHAAVALSQRRACDSQPVGPAMDYSMLYIIDAITSHTYKL